MTNTVEYSDYIAHLDGYTVIPGGWINQHYIQLGYQLADSVSGFAYSFGGSCIILSIMGLIPGLALRVSEEDEVMGIDDTEIGEFAVCHSPCIPFLSEV
jgi:ammonium transporter, Amt family